MPAVMPSVEEVRDLPVLLTLTIPTEWQDLNGHVNVQYYLKIYDLTTEPFLHLFNMDVRQYGADQLGYFDLEHHLWFRAELHVGDTVTTHFRFLAVSEKRFHGVMFIVNETRQSLAAAVEFVTTGADLRSRRTARLTPAVAQTLAELVERHSKLAWVPPTSGAISA